MLGAIYGDVVGSRFEFKREHDYNFMMFHPSCHFTDDSLATLAVGLSLYLTRNDRSDYKEVLIKNLQDIVKKYPNILWGKNFFEWAYRSVPAPYESYGNGAAMRISPVAWVCNTLEETIELSRLTTEITHNHPEAITGAEAVAVAIFMARNGSSKEEIKEKMLTYYPELQKMSIAQLRSNGYGLDEYGDWISCQKSIPQSICAFLDSTSFEDTIRKAVSLGADTDTQACIAGSIAEAYYGLTYDDEDKVFSYLDDDLRRIYIVFESIKKKRKLLEKNAYKSRLL